MSSHRWDAMIGCSPEGWCCDQTSTRLYVGASELWGSVHVYLDKLCKGDETAVCCELDATGEEVVVTGKLEREEGNLMMTNTEVCAPAP